MRGCRPLTPDEVAVVLQSFGGTFAARDYALFTLGLFSGFRVSELLSLRVKDVCQHGQLVDRVTVQRRHMKRKRESRTVPLHPQARAAVQAWLAAMPASMAPSVPDTFLFRSRKGPNRPISRVQALRILKEVFASCELRGKLGTHTMRKTFAHNVHERLGRDLVKTQRALGQKNITTTILYLSFRDDEITQAILAL
jgi:integrase